jgi:hypothetical protein
MSDVGTLGELNKKMVDEGVDASERKEALLRKKEELEVSREREKQEEMIGGTGKGKVKE